METKKLIPPQRMTLDGHYCVLCGDKYECGKHPEDYVSLSTHSCVCSHSGASLVKECLPRDAPTIIAKFFVSTLDK